jgi:DUF4097 and DUF4098 domain-containing protein YvlB
VSDSRRETFEVEGRPRIEFNLPSGEATFLSWETGRVEVLVEGPNTDELVVERRGGRIVLRTSRMSGGRWDSYDVTVRTPAGTDLEIKTASADVNVEVALGSLKASLASGDIRVGDVEGDASVEAASGDVGLGEVGGNLGVSTASGDVVLLRADGRVVLNTASGEVRLGSVLAALSASTQSGDFEVEHYEGDDLECNSTSGDVRIGLPSGRTLEVDLSTVSGDIRSDFSPEEGDVATARLRVKTVSGDIALSRSSG